MSDTATIQLLNYPLKLNQRSRELFEELLREFQLVQVGSETDGAAVPVRLRQLVEQVTSRYAAKVDEIDALRAPAVARGDRTMDLVYEVPTAVKPFVEQLLAVMEESDAYCRQGEHLLTLAAPPEIAEFRRWNLSEILRQVDGQPPTPWSGPLE